MTDLSKEVFLSPSQTRPSTPPETAAEAIRAYGLDWQVGLVPVQAQVESLPAAPQIPRARAVVRLDTHEPLGVVGRRFQPIQNRDAFTFFDHLVARRRAVYERAGACEGGRRIWIQAKLPGQMWITKDDPVEKYLLLSMSHGAGSLWVLDTPIRVWCRNTLLRALGEGKSRALRIRHVGDIDQQIRQAERMLEGSLGSFDSFLAEARGMAGRTIAREELGAFFRALVPDPKEGDPARAARTREHLSILFETGRGNDLPSVRGTLWAALNGVVQFVDYERPTREQGGMDPPASRWKSAQFGSGAALKQRAWKEALALLGQ